MRTVTENARLDEPAVGEFADSFGGRLVHPSDADYDAVRRELDRETQMFGLAVPAGIITHTGLAGLTLGGGIGWLMRKYGLTIDQLLSVDLVRMNQNIPPD